MVTEQLKSQALATLEQAGQQHRLWVDEVLNNRVPAVAEQPDQCDFGQWLLSADEAIKQLPEFSSLIAIHQQLHQAYSMIIKTPGLDQLEQEIRHYSTELLNTINQLEQSIQAM